MRLIAQSFTILTPISDGGLEELKHIELVGRVCYKSEDRITEDGESAKKFVKMLIDSGHEAMIEHSSLSVKFYVDRGISHEIVRHRLSSFGQESTRYVNYASEKFGQQINVIDIMSGVFCDPKMQKLDSDALGSIYAEWVDAMNDAEKHYMKMLDLGATPQIARSVLPTSTKTELVMTANYREWRHFFKLRTAKAAHPQMRAIATELLRTLQRRLPIIFDDICVAGDNS